MMNIPKDLKYSSDHEWARVEGKLVTIGITDYAQSQLGDVVFVDLPEVGSSVSAGSECGAIESVKAVSDIYSPVSGTIKEVNNILSDAPEIVNQDAYGEGWIVKIEFTDLSEVESLLDSAAYEKLCAEEG